MIKKALVTVVALVMVMSFTACGDSKSDSSSSQSGSTPSTSTSVVPTETPTEEPTAEPTEEPAADDGIISMETDDFSIVYSRHEAGTDYEGKPCLYYYYTFTNKSAENQSAAIATSVKAFQNGVECGSGISTEDRPEIENYMKEVQSGGALEVCEVYKLADTSDVTIEAEEFISFDDAKDSQVIAIQ